MENFANTTNKSTTINQLKHSLYFQRPTFPQTSKKLHPTFKTKYMISCVNDVYSDTSFVNEISDFAVETVKL